MTLFSDVRPDRGRARSGEHSSYAWSRFYIPRTTGRAGSAVALWAGIGQGNPGIRQIGVTLTMGARNYESISEWYEMWPAPAHAFRSHPTYPGDRIEASVQRSGNRYTLRLWDATRHWTDVAVASDSRHEGMSEAVAEAFGPSLPSFRPVTFTTSGYPAYGWSMGLRMARGHGSFTVSGCALPFIPNGPVVSPAPPPCCKAEKIL